MSKIKVLTKQLANIIAAGEVVERPASVVKELVENSIDSGATMITIEIKDGGISYIRVSDNGCGIAADEVKTAFLRHATSKINSETDLNNINTLGFRGEALASICAVAKVTMLTHEQEEPQGVKCVVHGSEIIELEESGTPVGTTITVRELFYNTPARMKFMKKDTYEANAVQSIVERIVLSNPKIKFKFVRGDKVVFITPGDNNLLSTVSSVLGREFAGELIKVNYVLNGLAVNGYISKPINARANHNMQHTFINGRYVKSKTATVALQEAYKNSIEIGRFPSCVLHIDISPSLVDVNVHPAKIEVRFVNEKSLFDAVYYAVKSSLNAGDHINELPLNKSANKSYININNDIIKTEEQVTLNQTNSTTYQNMELKPVINAFKFDKTLTTAKVDDIPAEKFTNHLKTEDSIYEPNKIQNTQVEYDKIHTKEIYNKPNDLSITVLGEVFATYAVVVINNDLLIVDKHAAHERLTFNKLKRDAVISKQYLLESAAITLTVEEHKTVIDNIDTLDRYGFEIENFGKNTIIVRATPIVLPHQNIELIIQDIAEKLLNGAKNTMPNSLDWLYNSIACRSSIKAGKSTSIEELTELINEAFVYEDIRYCPHGRPIAFKLSKNEIEKYFLRG